MTNNLLSVRLDPATARLLDEAARGKSRSVIVREAVRAYLAQNEAPPRPFDVVRDLVGCADSGRDDLSERASELVKERLRAGHARSR